MRKIVALLTSVLLLLGCTACKQKPAAQTPPTEQENVLIKAPLLEEQIDAFPIANADMAQVDGATVDIVVRIGTGEKITVYSGSFSA